jgi:hypothetical protein
MTERIKLEDTDPRWRYEEESEDTVGKQIFDLLHKKRRYVQNPDEAPDGVSVEEGPQGGLYYETEQNRLETPFEIDDNAPDYLNPSLANELKTFEDMGIRGGKAADSMAIAQFDGSKAFIRAVGNSGSRDETSPVEDAENAMTAYTILSELNSENVPEHYYNEGEWMGSVGVEGTTLYKADDELIEKIDREEALDLMSTLVLIGESDMHGDNLIVDSEGKPHVFDFDDSTTDLTGRGENRVIQGMIHTLREMDIEADEDAEGYTDKAKLGATVKQRAYQKAQNMSDEEIESILSKIPYEEQRERIQGNIEFLRGGGE